MTNFGLQLKQIMKNDPVVITGMGAISPAGSSVEELWESVRRLKTNVQVIKLKDKGRQIEIPAGRVKEIPINDEIVRKINKYDRSIKLGVYAACQALNDSGTYGKEIYENIGVIAGTSRGAVSNLSEFLSCNELRKVRPSYSSNTSIGALSGAMAQVFGFKGASMTISANCASSAIAIAISAQQILLGMVDAVLCGGAEAPLHPHLIAAMSNAGILDIPKEESHKICKPFDINRSGTIMGEGAGFLFLERMSDAIKRKARVHAVLAGFAYGITPGTSMGVETSGKSLADLIEKAMAIAEATPQDISFVSLHGTGTKVNDVAEARAVHAIFGSTKPDIPVFSIKPVTGHCLGASPSLEAIVCIRAIHESLVPATANCEEVDPECKINVVIKRPLKIQKPEYAMLVTSGFWGYKAVLIFKRI